MFLASACLLVACGGSNDGGSERVTFHAPLDQDRAAFVTLVETGGQSLAADFTVDGQAVSTGVRGGVRAGVRGGVRAVGPRGADVAHENFSWEVTFPVPTDASVAPGTHEAGITVFPEGRAALKLLSAGTATVLAISGGEADLQDARIESILLFTEPGRGVPNLLNLAAGVDPLSTAPDANTAQVEEALSHGRTALAGVPRSQFADE